MLKTRIVRVDHHLRDNGKRLFIKTVLLAHIVEHVLQDVSDAPLAVGHTHIQGDLPGELVHRQFLLQENLTDLRTVAVRQDHCFVALFQQWHQLFHAFAGNDEFFLLPGLVIAGNIQRIAAEGDQQTGFG